MRSKNLKMAAGSAAVAVIAAMAGAGGATPSWNPPHAGGTVAAAGTEPGAAYSDGPPAAHTGGFGEPTCFACHWDGELNAEGGTIGLAGLPDRIEPGRRYDLVLRLNHPALESAGFQLSARFADGDRRGADAGTLEAGAGQGIVAAGVPVITYLRQSDEGSRMAGGTAEWEFAWVAPREDDGTVVFHASANAANGDASEFGDRIYTLELVAPVGSSPP